MDLTTELEELIESYQRRRESIKGLIAGIDEASPNADNTTARYMAKLNCYRTIIGELQKLLYSAEPVAVVGNRPTFLPDPPPPNIPDLLEFLDWKGRHRIVWAQGKNKWENTIPIFGRFNIEVQISADTLAEVYEIWDKEFK